MIQVPEESRWLTIEGFVEAFEAAVAERANVELQDFLPAPHNALYLPVLCELVRVDLELAWERGYHKRLVDYAPEFPELFRNAASVRAIAFEEYRVRCRAGERPTPDDYHRRFGVEIADWPNTFDTTADRTKGESEDDSWRESAECDYDTDFSLCVAQDVQGGVQCRCDSPHVGAEFMGFRLVTELGRGAFGRVFLAQQPSLADRWIALKVSANVGGEPQTLAQLQHTHIVPVYSVHRRGSWQAVCMPYLGSTTLADVLDEMRGLSSWPDSGLALISTVVNRQQKVASTVDSSLAATAKGERGTTSMPLDLNRASDRAKPRQAIFDAFEQFDFTEAVLWIAARLADGLAHAHERGVLHCDLKPANILITDELQPMLVDFNLATNTKLPAAATGALVGGTLPYMAPEQLESLRRGEQAADVRGDIFSLGVILFELLTGRPPFPVRQGLLESVLPEMIADRAQPPPLLRCWSRTVSPAVESMVRCCLEPTPARRYRSARALQEDVKRHLANLPLRYAPDTSLSERTLKWVRRHPRLTSSSGVAAIAGIVLVAVTVTALFRGEQIARLESAENFRRFHEASKSVQVLLTAAELDETRTREGMAVARQALGIYGVLDNADWQVAYPMERLRAREAVRLRTEVADVLIAMARSLDSTRMAVESSAGKSGRDQARELNRLAESCFPANEVPRAVWLQRAEWDRADGDATEANRLIRLADRAPLRNATDYFQVAAEHLSRSEFDSALPLLEVAHRHDPQSVAVWLALGICHAGLGDFAAAASEFEVCSALWPESHWPHFQQALAHLDAREFVKARSALDRAIKLRPNHVESYINRGLARFGLADFDGAVQDYTHALDLGATQTRVYFMRANARQRAGDAAGAKHDRETGLTREPTDELSWIARGIARLGGDPVGALADFDHALAVNPRSREAMQNKANVLSERMGKTAEAVKVLDTAIALHPNYIIARAGRGVLLARLGRRDAAHADARETLALDRRPGTLYQVAGIFALTSRDQPADRTEALRLLATGIRQEPKWLSVVPKDPDLDPIRDDPDFLRLMQSMVEINAVGDPPRSATE